jgi:hypothetical protein
MPPILKKGVAVSNYASPRGKKVKGKIVVKSTVAKNIEAPKQAL